MEQQQRSGKKKSPRLIGDRKKRAKIAAAKSLQKKQDRSDCVPPKEQRDEQNKQRKKNIRQNDLPKLSKRYCQRQIPERGQKVILRPEAKQTKQRPDQAAEKQRKQKMIQIFIFEFFGVKIHFHCVRSFSEWDEKNNILWQKNKWAQIIEK